MRGLDAAVEERDVSVPIGDVSGAIGFNSALSLPVAIKSLVPLLVAAIDAPLRGGA